MRKNTIWTSSLVMGVNGGQSRSRVCFL